LRKLGGPLAQHTWGERNTAAIRHLLSGSIPGLGKALDMPKDQLPGDSNMPRFQAPSAGASERMAVSPGREGEGFFHMPCGQSGHPLSPFYRAGHEAWVRGEPAPFLPGPSVHTLTLVPVGAPHPRS
jgi:penicillin amidase